jgi:methylmalonyl-CoA/ethylmalonyl-CoA epimerase
MSLAKKIDHVAIAVKDLEAAVKTFTENFGLPVERRGEVPQLGMRNAFLTIGDASLELFQPTSEKNPALKFVSERGEGIYLLSLEVQHLTEVAEQLGSRGIKVAVQHVGDRKIGFISPKYTHGVILQLIEHPSASA